MKTLITKINEISEKAKNQFKPDLKKYGKNFRAISESAVLETLNPLLKEYDIAYEVIIQDKKLHIEKLKAGRDTAGNLIETLLFVAEAQVMLVFTNPDAMFSNEKGEPERMAFQGWGSGIDYGDKATGKAITAAVKYALFKGLRLQYSDDPDAEESQQISSIVEEKNEKVKQNVSKSQKKEEKAEPLATEGQLNYIKGLVSDLGMSDENFKAQFGCFPYDQKMSMRKAREILEELKKLKEECPFL